MNEIKEEFANNPFYTESASFIENIQGLQKSLPFVMGILVAKYNRSIIDYNRFLIKYGRKSRNSFKIREPYISKTETLKKQIKVNKSAIEILSESLLISLVSEFDTFRSKIIKVIIRNYHDILLSSDKSLNLRDLTRFYSLEQAQDYIIDTEIESLTRKGIPDFITWVERNFKIEFHESLKIWPDFVELIQRRHLFVHCDGYVNEEYINICNKHGVLYGKDIKVGEKLKVTSDYFNRAYNCIFEVGVKFSQLLWRKFYPHEIELADQILNDEICVSLLKEKQFELARIILDFASLNLNNAKAEDNIRRIYIINRAIAYKKLGNSKEAERILSSEDWSACRDDFKLAVAVLNNNYKEASLLMTKIGLKGDIKREQYLNWPLFDEFIQSKEFKKAYKKIYGEKLEVRVLSAIS